MLHEMGAMIDARGHDDAIAGAGARQAEEVLIGDLEDLEKLAKRKDCDLLITHSHGRQAAERLNIPFYRALASRCSTGLAPDICFRSAIAARAT